jgi:hypothetical protein
MDKLRRDFPRVPVLGARDGLAVLRAQLEGRATGPAGT